LPDHRDDRDGVRVLIVRNSAAAVALGVPSDRDPDHRRPRLRGAAARGEIPRFSVMRALMRPGIWLQRITTQEPATDQIEVAVASFEEVLRRETASNAGEQPV